VSSVEAQLAREQIQLVEARNLRSNVLDDLRRLTGIDDEIAPTEPLAGPGGAPEGPLLRAELVALQQRVTAADERVDAIVAGRKPSLALSGSADFANPNPRIYPRVEEWRGSWELGVSASWTLWDGGRLTADAAEAAAAARALRAREAEVGSLIATERRQRQSDLDAARAALTAANAAVASAADARRVVTERFNVGVATSTDVLDAHVVLLQAELDRTRALAGIRLAEARLERALGR
jgi:outer membrane protein TolC